jgi:hypothetical protein
VALVGTVRLSSPRLLGWAAVTGIGAATVIFIVISLAGPSGAVVTMPAPAFGPPWWFPLHLTLEPVLVSLWAAAILGGAGTAAGLAAVRRGAQPSARMLLAAAFVAAGLLTVLPPAGSTDTLDYAVYGRTVIVGHNPYVMTPGQLREAEDAIGEAAPNAWAKGLSVYGPLATAEEAAAAVLGGNSVARITFWLKLWNALAFGVIAIALDRLLRSDPARRARAHLLWSVNPLLLWNLVAGGHVDALAAAFGFLGLTLVARRQREDRPGALAALAAGALVGAAADIKITYGLFGLAVAWVTIRSPWTLAAAAAGGLAVLIPSYAWPGTPALTVLLHRSSMVTSDNFYQLFARPFGHTTPPHLLWIVVALLLAVAALLLARLPEGFPALPAVRPALAVSVAWLVVWPYQYPWYDGIVLCLLALYPASRLDWVMLVRLTAGTCWTLPGMAVGRRPGWLGVVTRLEHFPLLPTIMLGGLAAVVTLAVTQAWNPGGRGAAGPAATSPPRWPAAGVSGRSSSACPREPAAGSHAGARPERPSGDPGQRGTGRPGHG